MQATGIASGQPRGKPVAQSEHRTLPAWWQPVTQRACRVAPGFCTYYSIVGRTAPRKGLVLAVIAGACLLTACSANNNNAPAQQSSNTNSKPVSTAAATKAAPATKAPAATKAPTATKAASGPLQAGQSAKIGDIMVTYTGARIIPPSDVDTPKPGNEYIATAFTVQNTTSKPYNLSTLLQVSILDKDSHKYDETITTQGNGSIDGTIPPNDKVAGEVIFEVPTAGAPYRVRFSQPFGSTTATGQSHPPSYLQPFQDDMVGRTFHSAAPPGAFGAGSRSALITPAPN